jgi:allophanate hydrolase subunit 2
VGKVAAFEVLEPGILTTIQDLGRFGFSQFGVPPSGALDTFSFRAGNLLVGNREEEACIETTLMGLKIMALKEVVISITGGDFCPTLNEEPLAMWKTHLLVEGDVIRFKEVRAGCRAYLAVSGGFVVPKVMGSASTYLSGNFGGLEGRKLKRGDILHTLDIFQWIGSPLWRRRSPSGSFRDLSITTLQKKDSKHFVPHPIMSLPNAIEWGFGWKDPGSRGDPTWRNRSSQRA